ncbi:MAG: hypothetical protein GC155_08570 [Alphaproteobacteria bacterium]|nr:hypothetical protein [Alphaproteobacteria bacterium]
MPFTRLQPWVYLLAGVIPIALVVTVGDALPNVIGLPVAILATVWAGVMVTIHWKRLDEAARQAHRWAWYWGGSLGLGAAFLAAAIAMKAPGGLGWMSSLAAPFLPTDLPHEQSYLFAGIILTVLAQMGGFLLAWLWWWARRR